MAKVHFTDFEGATQVIEANTGDSIMETAVRNGLEGILGECGGSLSCATCHVFVAPQDLETLEPMEEMEDEMLYGTAMDREENSRLSCQIKMCEGQELHVTTPETQV